MHKIFRKLSLFSYKQFKLIWILFTIFLLIIFSYVNWHNNVRKSSNYVTRTAYQISNNVDNLIKNLFQEAYEIPSYEKKRPSCTDFNPYLQNIILNHPEVSAVIIDAQEHQIICSTLPNKPSLF